MRNWRGLFVFFVLAVVLTAAFGSAFAEGGAFGGESYTVDFFYGDDGEYHLPGGESMLLSQLFTELGISRETAEVTEAEFSDPSLLSLTHEGTDYRLTSLQPFHTTEQLRLNFTDSQILEITVKDEIASGKFGHNDSLTWSINDNGHFILEPTSGSNGTINYTYASATSKGGSSPRAGSRLWPWENYKNQIVTAEIKGEVRTYGLDLPGMFEYCDSLTTVDVSGLNVSRVGSVAYFFANCPKLKTITGLDTWADSVHQTTGETVGTGNLTNVASMFRGCASLEEVDLSKWTSDGKMKNFQNMFNGCTSLKSFKLNNENFITANNAQWQTAHHVGNGVFYGCDSLETVDMSNITIRANDSGMKGLEELFANLISLKEVNMAGIELKDTTDLSDMFNGCENLVSLVFSPKSKLENVTSMDGFVKGCGKLSYLDLSNLDNSELSWSNNALGFEDLDSLKTLVADNSIILIAKNYDLPSLLENVILGRDVDFIQDEAEFDFTPDYTGDTVSIDVNGVIQLVIHDQTQDDTNPYYTIGNSNAKGFLAPGTYERTSDIVPNVIEIPMTYYIIDGMDDNQPIIEFEIGGQWVAWDNSDNNYDSNYLNSGYTVSTLGSSGQHNTRIFTQAWSNAQWNSCTDSETDSCEYPGSRIRITYPNSATSVNGEKRDVHITINSITFQDMSRIPNTTDATYNNYDENFEIEEITNPWGPNSRRLDKYKIPGYYNNTSRRYILNADIGELRFWNQITREYIHDEYNYDITGSFLYSKGSGTDIDFTISIEGADSGQSVLYWCDDLDMPENESWNMFDEDGNLNQNPDDDVRRAVNYAPGAEGIVLGEGNDLSTITVSTKTYLQLYNYVAGDKRDAIEPSGSIQADIDFSTPDVTNYLIGSKPDPETNKTRFYVKGAATGANYLWTTGISCETTILKSTSFERPAYLDIRLEPTAVKTLNSKVPPSSEDRTFKFILEPVPEAEIPTVTFEENDYINKAEVAFPDPIETWNIGGNVDFGTMTFIIPGQNYVDTGTADPYYNNFKVYMDSDNQKFFYDGYDNYTAKTWTITTTLNDDGNIATTEIVLEPYEPCTDIVKAYVFKVTEEEGTQPYIGEWDKTEYYIQVVVKSPAVDAEMDQGTRAEITLGTKAEGDLSITWDDDNIIETTGYATASTPAVVNAGTFENKLKTIDIEVEKVWVDENNRDGIQPSSIELQLWRQFWTEGNLTREEDTDERLTLSVEDEWKGTFEGIALIDPDTGNEIIYTVKESQFSNGKLTDDPDTGYKMTLTGNQTDGFTVTNIHNPEKIDIAITKVWDDENDQDDIRPDQVFAVLYEVNGSLRKIVGTDFIVEDNPDVEGTSDWTIVFPDLPKFKEGEVGAAINYEADEFYLPDLSRYSKSSVTERSAAETTYGRHFDITNTYTPETIDIPVTKIWEDDNDRDQIRPDEVYVQLVTVDGEGEQTPVTGRTLTLDEDGEWTGVFTNLPKKNAGVDIKYGIIETGFDEDHKDYHTGNANNGYASVIAGSQISGFEITNTHNRAPRTLVVTKTWNDAGHEESRDELTLLQALLFEIDNNLYRLADAAYDEETGGFSASLARIPVSGTITETDTVWTITINGMPKYRIDGGTRKTIEYKISETLSDDYYVQNGANSKTDTTTSYAFTNHWNVTERKVCKTWSDEGHETERADVRIHLHGSDGSVKYHTFTDKADNMCYTFEDLPVYTGTNGGRPTLIEYTTHEETVENYVETQNYNENTRTFTITNVYASGQTLVRVTKNWDDGENRDDSRPNSVTFKLYKQLGEAEPAEYTTLTLEKGVNYGVFGPVDIYDTSTGESILINWIVEEVMPEGYTAPAGYNPRLTTYSWTFINHHDIETVEIDMTKTWDDDNNRYDLRGDQPYKLLERMRFIDTTDTGSTMEYAFVGLTPDANNPSTDPAVDPETPASSYPAEYVYTAKLDGNEVTITVTVTDLNTYNVKITGVPKNKAGMTAKTAIVWDINENPDTYEFTSESSAANTFTGSNFLNYRQAILRKVWKDDSAPENPDSFMQGVRLYYDTATKQKVYYYHGTETQTGSGTNVDNKKYWTYSVSAHPDVLVTIVDNGEETGDRTWTVTVDKMPRKINGELVTGWSVTEDIAGYTSIVDGLTITNIPETEVKVKKVWDDASNQDGYREDVTINLLWNNTTSGETAVLDSVTVSASSGDSWEHIFSNLQKYKDGSMTDEITYTVTETLPDSMKVYYTFSIDEPTAEEEAWVVTNTHEIDTINFKICKVWDDNEDQDGLRSTAAAGKNMRLLADGEVVTSGEFAVPTEDGCTTFMDLPKFQAGSHGGVIHYTAEEDTITGYTASFAEEDVTEADDPMGEDPTLIEYHKFEFTNTHTPETINVIVNKNWDDNNNQDGMRSKVTATIQLYKQPEGGSKTAVSGQTAEVGTENNWGHEFKNLPKYENGKEITYTVEETIVLRDTSLTTIPYTASYSGNMSDGLVVTNTHTTETIDLTMTKVWNDQNDQDGLRQLVSDTGLVFYLYQGVTVYRTTSCTSTDDTWTYTFEDLPKYCGSGALCVYTISEPQPLTGYTPSYNQSILTVTNNHTPETVTVQGSKTWADNDNRAGKRPGTIYIQLWKDNAPYTGVSDFRKAITAATEEIAGTAWSWKWEGLPKYENGKEIEWSVFEENVSEYQTTYPSGYNVTNTYNEGTTSVSVKKVWIDEDNRDGIRPTYIYVDLYADGVKTTQSKALADANNWLNTFTDLPIYRTGQAGQEIVYTVKEANAVTGYTILDPVYDDATNVWTITNRHSPETISLQGHKTWVNRDLDPNAPESITVHLYADGTILSDKNKTIFESSVEDGTNPWSWKWEGLPKYRAGQVGQEIVYTVRETPIQGYNTTYDSPNVTNTYSPGKTTYSVRKAWIDSNNQDGIRPGHVEVALLSRVGSSGAYTETGQTAILVPDSATPNLWRVHTFENLDRYTSSGQPISYSVKEIGTITGYTSSEPVQDPDSGVYVITNTHTPETIFITGEKVWDNDDDPTKPESITVHLLANGTEVSGKTITVTKDTKMVDDKAWTWKWEGLPKYANGQEITYTISEDTLEDYTLSVQRTPAADGKSISFVLTNKYEPGMITVRVQKVWEDNNNQDGIRPTTVEVKLIADGNTANPVATATLPQDGAWRARFNVPEYRDIDNKIKYVYTVEETATTVLTGTDGPGTYTQTVTGDVENGFVITNVHTPETVYIHGDKKWVGDDDAPAGTRPESVTFVLKLNNQAIAYTAASAPDWEWAFPLQPRYVGGVDVSSDYEVTELNVPNYETEIDGWIDTNEHDYTGGVTNVYTPGKTTLKVTKVWSDADNQDGIRPARVAVQLVADGTPVPERYLVLQGTGNSWSGTFNDLDIYAYGSTTPIAYTVQEVGTYDGYNSAITGNMTNGFTITNKHTPETVDVSGAKTWNDNDNVAGKRPASIEITLNKNGSEASGITNPVTVTADESWKWSWDNLPKYENGTEITWSVKEKAVENYDTSYSGYDVINTYDEGTTSVNVTKAWNDNYNQDGKRPSFVTVALYADDVATGKTLPLGESNNFTNTFTGLPIYKEGQVGQKITYTVKESAISGYTSVVTGDAEHGFIITNTYTPETVTVSGSKTWMDSDNAAGVRPGSITIRLHKNNAEYGSKTVTAADEWKWEWTDLPKYENGTQISWTITEDNVEDYTRQVSGYNVTNTYNPGKTSIRVSKSWKDADNQDGIRPQFIRVHLFANGADTGKEGVLTAPGWSYLFEDLDKNYTYTVVEDVPAGYTAEVNGSADAGFVVTNTHTPETVKIVVTKTWDDAGNEGNRPGEVTFYLHADGTRIDHGEFTSAQTAEPGWKWEINDLPKYKNGGTEIVYTVIENSYEDYTRSVSRTVTPKTETEPEQLNLAVTNKWTPGKTSIMVEKKWTDNNNQDGIRPDWVLVNLLDGNKNVVASDRVTKANNWILRFNNIDEFDASGNRINYTVEEVYDRTVTESTDGPGTYKFSGVNQIVGGFEIVNTHTPETVSISGTKTWDDNGNQDGKFLRSIMPCS